MSIFAQKKEEKRKEKKKLTCVRNIKLQGLILQSSISMRCVGEKIAI